jgi:hypothetical protein
MLTEANVQRILERMSQLVADQQAQRGELIA